RFAFEKFPAADSTLGTQMKSVGEVMAIGRTFKESLQKALRGLEIKRAGLGCDAKDLKEADIPQEQIVQRLSRPSEHRISAIRQAIRRNISIGEIYRLTCIDPWFLRNIKDLVELENKLGRIKN